jgi:beta-xylosidase
MKPDRLRADTARFFYSLDGESWSAIGDGLKMSYTIPQLMGYRFGLFIGIWCWGHWRSRG